MANRFELTDKFRNTLRSNPVESEYPGRAVEPAIWIETTDGAFGGTAVHIPLDRVEEVVAGLRDMARQASGQAAGA